MDNTLPIVHADKNANRGQDFCISPLTLKHVCQHVLTIKKRILKTRWDIQGDQLYFLTCKRLYGCAQYKIGLHVSSKPSLEIISNEVCDSLQISSLDNVFSKKRAWPGTIVAAPGHGHLYVKYENPPTRKCSTQTKNVIAQEVQSTMRVLGSLSLTTQLERSLDNKLKSWY